MGAPSTRSTTSSLWTAWADFHVRMAGERVPVLPLTAAKVNLVAAHLKEGGCRAYKTYQSRAKDMHVLAGFPWGVQLDHAFRKAALSVLRGLGASRQSAPFDLTLAHADGGGGGPRAGRRGSGRLAELVGHQHLLHDAGD